MSQFTDIIFKGKKFTIRRSAGNHIPVLRSVAGKIKIKKIIEIGTGVFSLGTFLNKKYFPDLRNVYSYETSNFWMEYMNTKFKDSRWKLKLIGENANAIDIAKSVSPVDMVFVDGTHNHRLRALTHLKDMSDLFVLHDSEIDFFKDILEDGFKYKFICIPPKYRQTAILSNTIDVSKINWDIHWNDDFLTMGI